MPLNTASPYSIIQTAEGNQYFLQSGVYYRPYSPYAEVASPDLVGPDPGGGAGGGIAYTQTANATAAQVAAAKAAGTPYAAGTVVIDSASPYSVLGVVDGSGNLVNQPLYTYTWAQTVALTGQVAGNKVIVSDLGYSIWTYNGTRWVNSSNVSLIGSGLPFIMQSSGSIGNNGALTGLTALGAVYSACYMYFPANSIAAGVAAGWYYVVMSSTTAGTIYNNAYTGGQPEIPTSPLAFATTGPGAYTQQTAAPISGPYYLAPANLLGLSSGFRLSSLWNQNGTAGAKYQGAGFGPALSATYNQNIMAANLTGAGATISEQLRTIRNRGAVNAQVVFSNFSGSSFAQNGNSTNARPAIDTTAAQYIQFSLQISVATDWIILDQYAIDYVGGN